MNTCDACGCEWDPGSQNHRRGIDCAVRLREMIDKHEGIIIRLRLAYQKISDQEPSKDKAILEAFEKQRDDYANLVSRFDTLAKRVNLLEHPKLVKVPSMPRTDNEKDK